MKLEQLNVYDEGYDAGYKDLAPNCPYEKDSDDYNNWWDGYLDGSHNS